MCSRIKIEDTDWGSVHDQAVKNILSGMENSIKLSHCNYGVDTQFHITTDASDYGWGCTLYQSSKKFENEKFMDLELATSREKEFDSKNAFCTICISFKWKD